MATAIKLASQVEERLLERNELFEQFFSREAPRLAEACREMSERFLRGGRLLAFGRGPYATDAQHVSVEFVHPVIVGKRALPALDLSILFRPWLEAILHPEDIVMGFGPPEGDPEVWATLQQAHLRDAMTFALPGMEGSYALDAPTQDPFMHQEMIEILYHTLWETVHVFFEHRELGHDVGESAFLYPFLGTEKQGTGDLLAEVAASILMKVHDDAKLRGAGGARTGRADQQHGAGNSSSVCSAAANSSFSAMADRPPTPTTWPSTACCLRPDIRPVPAVSLSLEPANITAVANDIGTDAIFLRQLIAQARPEDVAIGDLDQRRIAQHHHGAGRSAQTKYADGCAAGL